MKLWIALALFAWPAVATAQSVVVLNGAREDVLPGTAVAMLSSGASVVVQSGGTLAYGGSGTTTALQAKLTGPSAGAPLTVQSGGTLDLKFARLQSLTTLTIAAGATLLRAKDVVFEDLAGMNPATIPWLDVSAMTASDRDRLPFSLNRVTFTWIAGTRQNVKAGAATPLLRVLGNATAGGNRWSATYESDPSSRISWHTGAVTRSVSGSGTFDTLEDAIKDVGTTATSVLTVTLGASAFIDDYIDWNTNAVASTTGPIVKNANLGPLVGATVLDNDGGTGRRGKLINCVVARGSVDETSAENCTFYRPGASVITVSNVDCKNVLLESGYAGTGNTLSTSYNAAVSAFFVADATYDFHLAAVGGAAAIDEGAVLSETLDYEGQTRAVDGKSGGTGLWDIGADEYYFVGISSVTSTTANGAYKVGSPAVNVTVNFTVPLTLSGGNLQVTMSTGPTLTIAPFTNQSSVSASYTIAAGHNSADLNVNSPLGLSAGTLRDAASTDAVRTIPAGQNLADLKAIVIDTTAPTVVSVTSTTANGSYKVGSPNVNVRVTFSEAVTLSGGGSLTVGLVTTPTAGTAVTTTIAGLTVVDLAYTILANQNSADLNANTPLSVSGTLLDAAGNAAVLTIPAGQNIANTSAIVIDTTAPTVVSVTSTTANGSYKVGSPNVNVRVTFSEAVTLSGGGSLTVGLVTTPTAGTAVTTTIAGLTVVDLAYTILANQNSADLNANTPLSVSGTLLDAAGNAAVLTIPAGQNIANTSAIVIDTTAPTVVSVTSTTANGSYKVGSPNVNVRVTFSEAVTLSGGGSLTVGLVTTPTAGTAVTTTIAGLTVVDLSYTILANQNSADLNANTPLSVSGTLLDAAGNAAVLTIPAGQNIANTSAIVIDTTAPGISNVTSTTLDGTYGLAASINVTVNFTEVVSLTGGNLVVALNTGVNVSIPPFGPASSAVGTYVVAAGHNTPDLTNSSPLTMTGTPTLADPAGNASTLTSSSNIGNLKNIVIDTPPTVVSVSSTKPNGAYGQGEAIPLTVTFSEPVTLAGGSLYIGLNSWALVTAPPQGPVSAIPVTYTVGAGEASPDLTVDDLFVVGTLRDANNNDAVLDIPVGQNLGDLSNLIIDTAAPAVLRVTSTSPNGTYGTGQVVNVTIDFTKPVTLAGGNLEVNLNSGAGVKVLIAPFSGASTATGTYTVASGHSAADLNSTSLTLAAGATLKSLSGVTAFLTIPAGHSLGDYKNIAIQATPIAVPLPPTNVRTTAYHNAVDVEWDASPSYNVVGYNVYRRLASGSWPPTPTPLNGTTVILSRKYRDTTAANGTSYVYRVTALGN